MTRKAHIRAIVAVAALAVPLAGCGDEDVGDPIPNGKAATLVSQLDAARDSADRDLCDDAQQRVAEARATVDTLDDDGVGSDVQDALGDGVDNLGSLVSQQCEEEEEVETVPETIPEETIPEETTPETTPEPTPTTPQPTTPVPEPEEEPDEDTGGLQFDPDAGPPGQQKKEEDD